MKILKQNHDLNMQDNIIFFDTETNIINDVHGNEEQTLKLGWIIHTNDGIKEKYYFEKSNDFWEFVFSKIEDDNKIIIFAHNMEFDFKIVDGYNKLFKDYRFRIKHFYIEGATFILKVKKGKKEILFLDSMNYVPLPLSKIGKALKLEKMKINFNQCTKEELSKYCLNDTEILYQFIMQLIKFLKYNDLTKLRNTSASLSLNAFKHRFYNINDHPIYLHEHKNAIALERKSYRGGITDCFKIGQFKEKLYKLDINSMYPYIMKNKDMPIKLIEYNSINPEIPDLDKYHVIADCEIILPKDKAYVLSRQKINKFEKCVFIAGEQRVTLTTPEIEYVLKYGKIKKIYAVNIYQKANIFKEYVNFFYDKRKNEYMDNEVFSMFCKLMLNCLYGKFGAKKLIMENMKQKAELIDVKSSKWLDGDGLFTIMQIGKDLIKMEKTEDNATDSMVAIPSLITSFARMYLVELIEKAERKNVYYTDTDSLIVNERGLQNLKNYLDDNKLGMLKNEGVSYYTEIIKPKYYIFDNVEKSKGVKKEHWLLCEDNLKKEIVQKQFIRFKTALKNNEYDKQYVKWIKKVISKEYDKGNILNNEVHPYTMNDIS